MSTCSSSPIMVTVHVHVHVGGNKDFDNSAIIGVPVAIVATIVIITIVAGLLTTYSMR